MHTCQSHTCSRRDVLRNGSLVAAAAFVSIWAPIATSIATAQTIPDFCFIQVSDIHVNPRPTGMAPQAGGRSVDTLAWICKEVAKPQKQEPYGITAPTPAFVFATGDITEYGVIGETWSDFLACFSSLKCPLHVIPGNHDNTWTAMYHIMRERHGGDNFSFDQFGCHFVGLTTASPQEPVPSIDRRMLNWLRDDLAKIKTDTPVFVFVHHPLHGREFASPFETYRLREVLDGHNIVLILDGHGHGVNHGQWENLDRVMGGSTFGPNTGYSVISVVGGVLRVAYRFQGDKPMQGLLEKPVQKATSAGKITIVSPKSGEPVADRKDLPVRVRVDSPGAIQSVAVEVNCKDKEQTTLEAGGDGYHGRLDIRELSPGLHVLSVTVKDATGREVHHAEAVEIAPDKGTLAVRRYQHDAGFKAGPLLHDGLMIVADTAGVVTAFDASFKPQWRVETGGEVLATPTAADNALLFGSGDGIVRSVAPASGAPLWQYKANAPVYAQVVVHKGIAYVGDNEGYVHAIRAGDGKERWAVKASEYSIEAAGAVCGDAFCVGAWDGYVYGLALKDGSLLWKQRCPMGQGGQTTRYLAAADCPPVVVGDHLFITDRGYRLGQYQSDGSYVRDLRDKCAGIGQSEDGRCIYARTLDDRLIKYEADGSVAWSRPVPMGRFPIQPTERAGKVFVCSNVGLLTVLDARDGSTLWTYQVAPQLYVMGAVAADDRGVAYVTDMDGCITVIGPEDALARR
ncbi:MAG: PQQ-binding-like beta-propeller repeat protein [Phycisphaerae bacterium]|nr:PQQ-binding-like beta-propeller repeat protein [Phycisphaerae bacterium]